MHRFGVGIAAILCGTVASVSAEDICATISAAGARPGSLYVSDAKRSAGFRHVADGSKLSVADGAKLELGYIVPPKPIRSGVIVAKLTRTNEARTGSDRIALVRGRTPYTCGVRRISDVFFAWDYGPFDDDISIREYIYYHKTDADSQQTRLYRFHVNYLDREGQCVATDDVRNGNRQQFLFGDDKTKNNQLIIASLRQGVAAAVRAYGQNEIGKKIDDKQEPLEALVRKYANFSALEAQIHPYKTPDSNCVVIPLSNLRPSEKVALTINDLEQRSGAGARPRMRVERTWTMNVVP